MENNEIMENTEVNEIEETALEQYPETINDEYEDYDETSESGSVVGTLIKTVLLGGAMYGTYKAAPHISKAVTKLRDKAKARKDAKIRKYVAENQGLRDDIVLDAADAKLKATEEPEEPAEVPVKEEPEKKNKK